MKAKDLRGVIKAMDRLYPGLGHHLEEETTVAIDGAIHETAYFQPIRERRVGPFTSDRKGFPRRTYSTRVNALPSLARVELQGYQTGELPNECGAPSPRLRSGRLIRCSEECR
jgi:hypothetical protein